MFLETHGTVSIRDILKKLRKYIHSIMTADHPDQKKILCLFTDSSDLHWYLVPRKIPKSNMDLPIQKQNHSTL